MRTLKQEVRTLHQDAEVAASLSAAAANAVASISASSIESLQHVVTGLRSAPADEASSVHSLVKSLRFAAVAEDKRHVAATCTAACESSGLRAAAVIERERSTTAATAATVAATAAATKLCGLQAEVDCLHAAATAAVADNDDLRERKATLRSALEGERAAYAAALCTCQARAVAAEAELKALKARMSGGGGKVVIWGAPQMWASWRSGAGSPGADGFTY